MNRTIRIASSKRTIRIAGSLALVGLLFWRLERGSVIHELAHVDWLWWLAAFLCYIVAQLISSIRWQELARPYGFSHSYGAYVAYYFVGNFFNLVLPTSVGGDVARAWYLGRGTGRAGSAVLCVLADRLIGLYVLVAMACVAAMFVPLPGWIVAAVAVAGLCGAAGLIVLRFLPRIANPDTAKAGKLRELAAALDVYLRAPRLLIRAAAWSLFVQLLNVLMVWCLAQAIALDNLTLGYCLVLMPLVTLLTLAPISVNGMGVREGGTVVLLAPLEVATASAVTLSLLWFSIFVAAGLVGAVWYLSGCLPRCEVRNNAESVGGYPDQGRTGQPKAAA
jgi:uncharacterized membrane protein YbhN (UPF0104 family)